MMMSNFRTASSILLTVTRDEFQLLQMRRTFLISRLSNALLFRRKLEICKEAFSFLSFVHLRKSASFLFLPREKVDIQLPHMARNKFSTGSYSYICFYLRVTEEIL